MIYLYDLLAIIFRYSPFYYLVNYYNIPFDSFEVTVLIYFKYYR